MKINTGKPMNGWLALSPLALFLCIYLISSVVAADFYKVPIAAAFLLASAYALLITRAGSTEKKIAIFSEGAGNGNVLMMIWIFVLAGAFAGTAKDMGAIDASVNFALSILPGKFIYAGLFLASCFISMAIGTSVGTVVALVPMASGIAAEAGMDVAFVTAIVTGGAFFGDNLSFISDTTIAATRTQGCTMSDKFRVNIGIVAPAALIVTVIYVFYVNADNTAFDDNSCVGKNVFGIFMFDACGHYVSYPCPHRYQMKSKKDYYENQKSDRHIFKSSRRRHQKYEGQVKGKPYQGDRHHFQNF